jgi:hypothetical protein
MTSEEEGTDRGDSQDSWVSTGDDLRDNFSHDVDDRGPNSLLDAFRGF